MRNLIYRQIIFFSFYILEICFAQLNVKDLNQLRSVQNLNESQLKKLLNENSENSGNNSKQNTKNEQSKILKSVELDKSVNSLKIEDGVVDIKDNTNITKNIKKTSSGGENSSKKEKISKNTEIEKNSGIEDQINDVPYFGYDLFQKSPEIFENSINESLDPGYLIGPGDEIIIMLWGQTEFNNSYVVAKDGYLFIENIGQVFVNGLTLKNLEKKLLKMFTKVHSSLDPVNGNPSTFFDISLGSSVMKPKRIFVVGEVDNPGAYFMSPSTSIYTSLYYFGGPNNKGSLRDIKLIRAGKEFAKIDFYDFLLTGKTKNDVRLNRDDVIFIPQREKTVIVKGEISREAVYEIKEGETLKDLIDIAGGIKNTTYMKLAQIRRILDAESRFKNKGSKVVIDFNLYDILNSKDDFDLLDGDVVSFKKIISDYANKVTITGAVERAGSYSLDSKARVLDLISKAGGFTKTAYTKKIDISRTNDDNSISYFDIDLEKALKKDLSNNILLMPDDIIKVYDYSQMRFRENIKILGHVKSPGVKKFKKGMTLFDLLFLGGGFENTEHLKSTYFDRAVLSRKLDNDIGFTNIFFRVDSVLAGKTKANELIKMGDEVTIFSLKDVKGFEPNSVEINGNVKRPGKYNLVENMRLSDLFFLAGGFEDQEFLSDVYTERGDIFRSEPGQSDKKIIRFNVKNIIEDIDSQSNFLLQNNDKIRIYNSNIFEFKNYVEIRGEVKNTGKYELKSNMTLTDLIFEAGGVKKDKFNFRYEIARIDPQNDRDNEYAKIINGFWSKEKIKKNDAIISGPTVLQPYDIVYLRSDPYFKKQDIVDISGFVFYPGQYVLDSPNLKVTDLIQRAGGLKADAYPEASKIVRNGETISVSFREIIKRPKSKKNFNLMANDKIIIGSRPNVVVIRGEVYSPGNFQFIPGATFKDYLTAAGGYTEKADRNAVIIKSIDGKSKKIKFFNFSPSVLDGSEIIVGAKAESAPFSLTDYVTNLTAIWADVTQAYLLILVAARQ